MKVMALKEVICMLLSFKCEFCELKRIYANCKHFKVCDARHKFHESINFRPKRFYSIINLVYSFSLG